MKAAMRWGSVKVSKSCSAVVRNSWESERVVTLILEADVLVFDVDLGSSFCFAMEELSWIFGVLQPDDGLEPGACWMSLPCSFTRTPASFCKRFRISGVISSRTRSLTASFERSDE